MVAVKRPANAKVALNLAKTTVAERSANLRAAARGQTSDPRLAGSPVTAAMLNAAADSLDLTDSGYATARHAVVVTHAARVDSIEAADTTMIRYGAFVDGVAGGDETVIRNSGLSPRGKPVRSKTPPAAPDPVKANPGKSLGEALVKWTTIRNARSYILQHTLNPTDPTTWVQVTVETKTQFLVTGLAPGRHWFRVAVVTAAGQSAWSDPATCTAG